MTQPNRSRRDANVELRGGRVAPDTVIRGNAALAAIAQTPLSQSDHLISTQSVATLVHTS